LRRLVERTLLEWKTAWRRKPLIVRGARQVGKTYSIEKFGRDCFDDLLAVDLERNRQAHRAFGEDIGAENVLSQLEVLTRARITPGRTLLFLDEIQSCPRAITALRYLYEERPELHVVAAGSLMEFALGTFSFPVGRVQFLEMYPMTFAEYLWAIGNDPAADTVLGEPKAVGEAVHRFLLDELRKYCFVGGMPASVRAYVETRSVQRAFDVQRGVCESYREDFAKYAPRVDSRCLEAVLRDTAQHVGKQLKYARLAEGHDRRQIRKAFDTLRKARVIRRVPCASPPTLPLGASASARRFKVIMVDVGLWQSLSGIRADLEYVKADLLDIYRGAMAEQYVGQAMAISQEGDLCYWARSARGSSAEVDYLAVIDGQVRPVEVKSGAPGRLKSMRALLDRYPDCPGGLVFSSAPYAELPEQKLTFLPLYYAYSATRRSTKR